MTRHGNMMKTSTSVTNQPGEAHRREAATNGEVHIQHSSEPSLENNISALMRDMRDYETEKDVMFRRDMCG